MENESNTPDFILANYLGGCLRIYNEIVGLREEWYGRKTTGDADESKDKRM